MIRQPLDKEKLRIEELAHDFRGGLVRQGQKAHQQDINRLDTFLDGMKSAENILKKLRVCPVCKYESRVENFDSLDKECFECSCAERDCGAVWGVRLCQSCDGRYPYLRFSEPIALQLPKAELKVDWVDREYGMDVLASPCPALEGTLTFICPFCGNCGRQYEQNESCKDCQGFRKPITMENSR